MADRSLPPPRGIRASSPASSSASGSSPPATRSASSRASTSRPPPDDDDDDDAPSSRENPRAGGAAVPHPLSLDKLSISDDDGGSGAAAPAPDYAAIRRLMQQGSWRAIADAVQDLKKRARGRAPDEQQLVCTAYQVLALVKLRKFAAAQAELEAVGDLDAPQFRFENRADPGRRSGSMVPFGLKLLHAELPHQLGQTAVAVDRLYDLLAHCNDRIDFLVASADRIKAAADDGDGAFTSAKRHDAVEGKSSEEKAAVEQESKIEDVGSNFVPSRPSADDSFGEFVSSDGESEGNVVYATLIQRWRRRQEVVLSALLGHHLEQKEFMTCLNWLEDLVRKRPRDVVVLSKYGYVRLQLGDLYGARHTFATIESICDQQGRSSSPVLSALVSRNRGLLFFSLKQYPKALKDFNAALEIDPTDVVSANNKALCLMYSRDLIGATEALETVLQSSPITALNETVVLNLCSMYELASMNSIESKKTLSSWILRIAPDDFDLGCTRL